MDDFIFFCVKITYQQTGKAVYIYTSSGGGNVARTSPLFFFSCGPKTAIQSAGHLLVNLFIYLLSFFFFFNSFLFEFCFLFSWKNFFLSVFNFHTHTHRRVSSKNVVVNNGVRRKKIETRFFKSTEIANVLMKNESLKKMKVLTLTRQKCAFQLTINKK